MRQKTLEELVVLQCFSSTPFFLNSEFPSFLLFVKTATWEGCRVGQKMSYRFSVC